MLQVFFKAAASVSFSEAAINAGAAWLGRMIWRSTKARRRRHYHLCALAGLATADWEPKIGKCLDIHFRCGSHIQDDEDEGDDKGQSMARGLLPLVTIIVQIVRRPHNRFMFTKALLVIFVQRFAQPFALGLSKEFSSFRIDRAKGIFQSCTTHNASLYGG